MDTRGRIYELPEGIAEQLQADGIEGNLLERLHSLTDDEAEALKLTPEDERVARLEAIRNHPLTSIGDVSDDEARKIRNAAKRLRRQQRGK